jgi:RNA polymerase sigma-70 factor (ECF subfamily)
MSIEKRQDAVLRAETSVSDEELLSRMAGGDESALAAFYDRYRRLVYSLALRVVRTTTEAEEVTADVFWQAWKQAGQYNSGRSKVYTWLMMIARTRAIDRQRSLKRQEAWLDVMEERCEGPMEQQIELEDDLCLIEQRRRVMAALDSLPEAQRLVIELAYYEGLSQSEIAARLNQPLGTVKGRIRMAMAHLRDQLLPFVAANNPSLSRAAYISELGQ